MELLTKSAYAKRRGVSRAAVTLAVRRCKIPLQDGKLDPAAADTLWALRTDAEMARRAGERRKVSPSSPPALAAAVAGDPIASTWRERRDRAQAKLVELRVREREAELLDVQRARREFWGMFQLVASLIDSFPQRIAHDLAGLDQAGVYQVLCAAVRHLRHDIVDAWTPRARSGLMSEALRAMEPLGGRRDGA